MTRLRASFIFLSSWSREVLKIDLQFLISTSETRDWRYAVDTAIADVTLSRQESIPSRPNRENQ